ncbi:MAG: GNAT family N-acetyltransferase [Trueperaceae bacterium]|nr:MAG: GNAT family N-acetyltransferase [Trueperaceae bacterium]
MSSRSIRPFEEGDYPAVARLWNEVFPEDRYTPEELAYYDAALPPPCEWGRWVALESGDVVAVAEYQQMPGAYHPRKFHLQLYVDPRFERRGIGSALYDRLLEELKPFDPLSLRTRVKESLEHAVRFATARGFVETKRDWKAVLDLSTFDPNPHQHLAERLQDQGISLVTLADLTDGEGARRRFHELFSTVRIDVPRSEPPTELSFDQFRALVLEAPDFFPEGVFLALVGEEMIGMSHLFKGSASEDLYAGLTGVRREYRGRGVAKALKVEALRFAKESGAPRIYTENDTTNLEMIAINDKLGFVKLPAWLSMAKVIGKGLQIRPVG